MSQCWRRISLKPDVVCQSYGNVYRGAVFSWTRCIYTQNVRSKHGHHNDLSTSQNAKIHYTSFPVASPQRVRNKLTREKSGMSVVSFPKFHYNDLLLELVADLLAHQQVRNKSAASPLYGEVKGKRV